jgi:hypothetical protein
MEYLALLVPAMTLTGLPLIDRLERWALDRTLAPADPANTGPSTAVDPGELT